MSGHTPGPWMIGTAGPNGCRTIGTTNGLMVAVVAHSINHADQYIQAVANARLIAAAPDLLSVCQRLAAVNVFSADNDVAQIIMMACDAVEKATGEKA